MKDFDLDNYTHSLPASGYWGDVRLPAGLHENNSAFDIPNSEGNEAMKYPRPKTVAVYCPQCSHHVIVPARVDENFSKARVEKCANCFGTGGRCKKCDEENKARRPKEAAA